MTKEILYTRSLSDMAYRSSIFKLELPKLDIDEDTKKSLYLSMQARHSISLVPAAISGKGMITARLSRTAR